MTYPFVFDEFKTIAKVAEGYCLARLGDGELKIAYGAGYVREPANQKLSREMMRVLEHTDPRCIVGIPTMERRSPKYASWIRHADRFERILPPGHDWYSSLVTRPDSAPWIFTKAYGESVQALWAGKKVAVICEAEGSMVRTVSKAAKSVQHIICPRRESYAIIHDLERAARRSKADIIIMSVGPTATCLANRLARRGLHAVDLGSAGGFIAKALAL